MNRINKIKNFITKDIWSIKINSIPKIKATFIIFLRVAALSLRGFFQDKCQIRASALTFFSLLSIVPVFAFLFGLAKGFGFEKMLENIVMEKLGQTQPEVAEKLIQFSKNALSNVKGGVIAGIGLLLLFWTVIKLLGNIENSFNEIWGIKRSRKFIRKITDYLSIIVFSFIMLVFASGLNVYIKAKLIYFSNNVEFFSRVSAPAYFLLNISPYIMVWIAFTFIYVTLPNTSVPLKAGLAGGITAGTIYQLFQKAYILFQLGVSKYNAVYGSLAALPLFLIWLQLSWIVVLFGAEITFAAQTHQKFEKDIEPNEISQSLKEYLSLLILTLCIDNFTRGKEPLSLEKISNIYAIPIKIVRDIVYHLLKVNLLTKICENNSEKITLYKSPDFYTIYGTIEAIRNSGIKEIKLNEDAITENLKTSLEKLNKYVEQSEYNKKLSDLLN